ncbi:hypothetical protein NLJ89_g5499 [Agrocybe chaxingu]|uniref:AA9 family lytic polysaccharide monooxygenase n=1 Tax=Agrocybe chaxingu TaxID=84603 RepID=A0A9W8MTJ5_9AGAR|nr:hypothetical protein NLJ89_g5499 [Agrocybe chaxingu]
MMMKSSIIIFLLLAASAPAHTIFQELWVNGVSAGHLVGIRAPSYDGPITDVNSNDVICNGGINPYLQPVSKTVIPVPAGAQVTAEFHHTLTSANTGDVSDPIDASHKGPILAYMAQVPDATQSSVTGLKWFKVYHDGLSSGTWAVDKLIQNKGKVSFAIPTCIPSGQYLLRVELIALHGAGSYPGTQLYMECAQIQVTGGGNTSPATVNFPGAYKGSDPGITVNIYSGLTSYTIPGKPTLARNSKNKLSKYETPTAGPPVFSCSGSSNPGPGTSPATTANPVTTAAPITTIPAPVSTAVPGTVAHYGQCGGQGSVAS